MTFSVETMDKVIARAGGWCDSNGSDSEVWQHTLQGTLSGYRERVAHNALDNQKEGGLNVDMPPELVTSWRNMARIVYRHALSLRNSALDGFARL